MQASEDTTRQLVVFSLAGEHYGLPIEQVHEIIRFTEPRSVASASNWVRGVIGLRGRILPVYDVAARIGVDGPADSHAKIVIAEFGGETAGVIVDSVEEVLTVSESQIDSVPTADSPLIEAIARVGDRLIALLTLENLFPAASPEQGLAA